MSAVENKKIIQAYFDELNSGRPKNKEMMDRYISDADMSLKEHIQVFEAAFPAYQLIPKEIIAQANKVSVSFNFIGTHKATFNGIPATNKKVNIPGFISYHLDQGKIVAHDLVVDTMMLMQQLGVLANAA